MSQNGKKLEIEFSHNYKKLKNPFFLTCRKYSAEKLEFYEKNRGKLWAIKVTGTKWFSAVLLDAYIKDRSDMTQEFVDYDTEGIYTLAEGKNIVLLFKKEEVRVEERTNGKIKVSKVL